MTTQTITFVIAAGALLVTLICGIIAGLTDRYVFSDVADTFADIACFATAVAIMFFLLGINMKPSSLCPNCGEESFSDYCSACGSPINTAPTCSECGVKLDDDWKFCESCGTPIPTE